MILMLGVCVWCTIASYFLFFFSSQKLVVISSVLWFITFLSSHFGLCLIYRRATTEHRQLCAAFFNETFRAHWMRFEMNEFINIIKTAQTISENWRPLYAKQRRQKLIIRSIAAETSIRRSSFTTILVESNFCCCCRFLKQISCATPLTIHLTFARRNC